MYVGLDKAKARLGTGKAATSLLATGDTRLVLRVETPGQDSHRPVPRRVGKTDALWR